MTVKGPSARWRDAPWGLDVVEPRGMFALSSSELGIVVFILLLVVAAGKLPAWAESLGSRLYRRKAARQGSPPKE